MVYNSTLLGVTECVDSEKVGQKTRVKNGGEGKVDTLKGLGL